MIRPPGAGGKCFSSGFRVAICGRMPRFLRVLMTLLIAVFLTGGQWTMLQSVALTGTLNRTFSIYLKRKTGTGNISITVDGST